MIATGLDGCEAEYCPLNSLLQGLLVGDDAKIQRPISERIKLAKRK